jgi:protein ImuA
MSFIRAEYADQSNGRLAAAAQLGATQAMLQRLTQEVQQLELAGRQTNAQQVFSSGCSAMDACLPHGGYLPGSLIEYLRTTSGCGTTYLALTAAAAALQATEEKYLVIVDTHQQMYPPCLLSHHIPLSQVIWVHPQSQADAVWATDQALRTPAVAAVIADLENLDERDARRLQLAAERGGGLGILLRTLAARRMPSWSDVQWVVRSLVPTLPQSIAAKPMDISAKLPLRRLEVQLARVRGGKAGAALRLDIDGTRGTLELAARQHNYDKPLSRQHPAAAQPVRTTTAQTNSVRLASQLAHPANPSRRASAG